MESDCETHKKPDVDSATHTHKAHYKGMTLFSYVNLPT